MPIGAIIGGVSSIVGGIFGSSSAKKQSEQQQKALQRQQQDAFLSQMDDWQYSQAANKLNFDYAVNSAKLAFNIEKAVALQDWETSKALEQARYIYASTNAEMEWQSQTAAQQRDFDITRTLQAADYRQQLRVFEASERTFSQNTRLISAAAKQAYSFEKDRLRFERAGIRISTKEARTRFAGEKKEANLRAKQVKSELKTSTKEARTRFAGEKKEANLRARQVETKYRSELRQAGFSGEALQMEVKRRMQEFTGKQDSARREASVEAAAVAASGRSGATMTRMMQDPFSRSDIAIGSMGVELAFFGNERQVELMKLAEATNLAGLMADIDRQQIFNSLDTSARMTNISLEGMGLMANMERQRIFNSLDTSARMTNLTLEGLNLQEREAIFRSNNQIDDTRLQARSQMNEAKSNRELRPMGPVRLPQPLPIARTLTPQPFMQPRPLQLAPGLQPLLPSQPLAAPMPRMGSPIPRQPSGAGGILASSILQGAAGFANAFQSVPKVGTLNPLP